jgi:RsiW-degrading membrane proteinase PrsW (M82 family)
VTVPRRTAPAQIQPGRAEVLRTLPAWLMLTGVLLVGGWRLALILRDAYRGYPVATSLALALFALYAVPFVIFLRAIDYLERQPPLLQVAAFAWGGVVATSAAIAGGTALQDILAKTVSPGYAAQWGPAVAAAGLEEALKLLGVIAVALLARRSLASMLDGFVYGALVGLGFQVVEDVVFATSAVALDGPRDAVGPVLVTFVLRGFIGGLWSHTLFTALAGAGVAYALVRRDRPMRNRILVAAGLFGAAWGAHFLWNSPWFADGFGYGPAGALLAVVVKGIPAVAVGTVLFIAAERQEADYYSALLAGQGDPRLATADEIRALVSPRRRVAARRRARARLGWAGGRAVRRLQRAQAQLAVALSREPSRDAGPEVRRRRRDVLSRRHQLVALALAGSPARTGMFPAAAVIMAQTLAVGLVVAGIGYALQILGGS